MYYSLGRFFYNRLVGFMSRYDLVIFLVRKTIVRVISSIYNDDDDGDV